MSSYVVAMSSGGCRGAESPAHGGARHLVSQVRIAAAVLSASLLSTE